MGETKKDAAKETPVLKEVESLFLSILSQKNYVGQTSEYLLKPFSTAWESFWKLKDAQLYFCGCFFPFLAVSGALLVPFISVCAFVLLLWLL